MNYDRIYQYRFRSVDRSTKIATWKILAEWLAGKLGRPSIVLDPAAGACEFINAVPAKERWAVDMGEQVSALAAPGVRALVGRNTDVDLPESYFDGVFVSNVLEHLDNQEAVAAFLEHMHRLLKPGGRIVVMGPNFRACPREYFDFADHTVILTERAVAEHLYAAGFELDEVHPRFLPVSFGGGLPVTDFLVKSYLRLPFAWRFLGKQFLLVAHKPSVSSAPAPRIT
ncbi:MAG: methyltransferase domain-containing protein [Planctomycetes bacterium]|nr:methyltransferase domain-containing protein [Planctomycetota bacterium]